MNLSQESSEISRNPSLEDPVKMLTEFGDFLENFRRMILHREIHGIHTDHSQPHRGCARAEESVVNVSREFLVTNSGEFFLTYSREFLII